MSDVEPPRPSAFSPARVAGPHGAPARRARRHWTTDWRGGLALIAISLSLHLPGVWSLPPIDRDEARFAEASRRMAVAETWRDRIVPMIQDKPRLKKPPLTYWLQAPVAAAAGVHAQPDPWSGGIWAYRVPGLLAALGAVLLTWRLGTLMFAPPCGWWAGVLLAACAVVLFDVRQARADQLLLFCTTLAYYALWRIWHTRSSRAAPLGRLLLLWTAVALGILAKGPITPTLVAFTVLGLTLVTRETGWWRRLRPGLGIRVMLIIATPWFLAVGLAVGWDKLLLAFLREVVLRSVTPMESHWGPPGLYVVLLPLLFWPGSLALAPGLWRAVRRGVRVASPGSGPPRWYRRLRAGRAAELFCLAWLLPGLVTFELIVTKLPHYPLPLFPALALLTARGLCDRKAWHAVLGRGLGRAALIAWVVLTELLAVGLPLLTAVLTRGSDGEIPWAPLIVLVALAQVGVLWGARELRRRRFVRGQAAVLGATVATAVALFSVVLPSQSTLWISSRLNVGLHRVDPHAVRPLAATGYQEDSLVFLTQGRVRKLAPGEVAAWWQAHPDGLLIAAPPPDAAGLHRLLELEGFNYGGGRRVRVALVQRATDPTATTADRPPAAAPP
mgnify:CR=1 FL=1